MGRKVFLSFLGTNNYLECIYTKEKQESSIVKFIQTALIQNVCLKENWNKGEYKIYIFTTSEVDEDKEGKKCNWNLLQEEVRNKVECIEIENVRIKSGKSVHEIWENFDTMYKVLQVEDELHIDVTHSFRSIPLLFSLLIQYAKLLINVSIKGIYYGAFETLGAIPDIKEKYPDPKDRKAPIFDLTAFSEIQDWSIAANNFISFGNSSMLNKLTGNNLDLIIKNEQKDDLVIESIKKLNENIKKLCLDIKTNRSHSIISGENVTQIIEAIEVLKDKEPLIKPLSPLLCKIEESVESIKTLNSISNILYAVSWCIDKQLIQEGLTLLREGVISYVLKDYHLEKPSREFVSAFLKACNNRRFDARGLARNFKIGYEDLNALIIHLNSFPRIRVWGELYKKISDVRNDISHAGIGNSHEIDSFEDKLAELYNNTIKLI